MTIITIICKERIELMAGYIMALGDNENVLEQCFNSGIYGTILDFKERTFWNKQQEGTLADYASMKEGDNIYFFKDRKIYGIGKLINVYSNCKYFNYPSAYIAGEQIYNSIKKDILYNPDSENSKKIRVICTFEPHPLFFKEGVDMDEALNSNSSAFKMLRAFWKVSFIKLDDEENKALFDILMKVNEQNFIYKHNFYSSEYQDFHSKIREKLKQANYEFNPSKILSTFNEGSYLKHEMGLELAILHQLNTYNKNTIDILGTWDYLSHQVIASPFKPIDYMDKIDIFAYSYIKGLEIKTKNKYLVAELKRDIATIENIEQLLKYVDFVNHEYASNDYSMIRAFLIAHKIPQEVIDYRNNYAKRFYTYGTRPTQSKIWTNLELVEYKFNELTGMVELTKI